MRPSSAVSSAPQSWVRGPKPAQAGPLDPKADPEVRRTGPEPEPGALAARTQSAVRPARHPGAPQGPRTGSVSSHIPQPRRNEAAPVPAPGGTARTKPARARSRHAIGWVKAHGGAGATSLADLLGGADLGKRWPDPTKGEPGRIVVVGRTSASGLRSVSQALDALRDGRVPSDLDLLAVVLVADAPGRLPLSLLSRIRVIRSVVHVHRVPWIPAWRVDRSPRSLPRQLTTLADLVGGEHNRAGAVL
ncbi:DUF6668 family protein [Streptomyces sp. NPDC004250]|uniref:DUF6668 family protein n=1 Tax=Streptomyces sp. NPDC004250 TaxID=3364692 RepID=UPI0036A9CD14